MDITNCDIQIVTDPRSQNVTLEVLTETFFHIILAAVIEHELRRFIVKILLVDDDPDQLLLGVIRLSRDGRWQVETARNGNEALLKIQTFAPDVLITDNEMPVMNGPELIRCAKEINPKILAILLSGLSSVHELASSCGADASFQKPFRWHEMLFPLLVSWDK